METSRFVVRGELPVGLEVTYGGQSYCLVRFENGERSDGSPVGLAVWATNCSSCGEQFEMTSPAKALRSYTRRCSAHRAPGRTGPGLGRRARRKGKARGRSGPGGVDKSDLGAALGPTGG